MLANLQFFSYRAFHVALPITQLDVTDRFIPRLVSSRIISKKSLSFCMTTFSVSHKNRTVLPPQWRDCSCDVSRPIQAPQPFWLQKRADLRTHNFVHSPDLWYPSRLVKFTCTSRWRFCGINPAVTSGCVAFILSVRPIGVEIFACRLCRLIIVLSMFTSEDNRGGGCHKQEISLNEHIWGWR